VIKTGSYVLVYCKEKNGEIYRVVNFYGEYPAVYKTSDNRWASAVDVRLLKKINTHRLQVKPRRIRFAKPVIIYFHVPDIPAVAENYEALYPTPYYERYDRKAVAHYGFPLKELLQVMNATTLKSLGLHVDIEKLRN